MVLKHRFIDAGEINTISEMPHYVVQRLEAGLAKQNKKLESSVLVIGIKLTKRILMICAKVRRLF